MNLAGLAGRRRTHKSFGSEPVPRETLLELLDVARLAPNHHLTQPWRFHVLGPEALARVQECAGPGEAAKLERAPTLVLATAVLSGSGVMAAAPTSVMARQTVTPVPSGPPGSTPPAGYYGYEGPPRRRRPRGHPRRAPR